MRAPVYYPVRDVRNGREFQAEWSDIAGEWYEKETGKAFPAGDIEIIKPATHGGPRPGAGRPRKGEQPRVTISFSVDRETARMLRELRNDKVAVNNIVEDYIRSMHIVHFDISK